MRISATATVLCAAAMLSAALAISVGQAAERLCTPLPCKHHATVLPPLPDGRRCYLIAATHGGQTKVEAVANAQQALKEMIPRWGRLNGLSLRRATIKAMRPEPLPYYRSEVTADLVVGPDVTTGNAHTTCWEGIVLPVGCTAGAKVCG